jgi:hypothetical protein
LIHREGEGLQDEAIAVTIDDQPGQSVALAPDEPTEPGIDPPSRPIFHRLGDPALEEIEIEILFPARETPGHDLRFRIVNGAPNEVIAPVLERDDIAVVRRTKNLQDFAPEDPVVAVENSRARFNNKAAHRLSLTGRAPSGASRSHFEKLGEQSCFRDSDWQSRHPCLRVPGYTDKFNEPYPAA